MGQTLGTEIISVGVVNLEGEFVEIMFTKLKWNGFLGGKGIINKVPGSMFYASGVDPKIK